MVEWVAYMDESGNRVGKETAKSDGSDVFVLTCVTGSPTALSGLSTTIRGFKRGLAPGTVPDDWELKGQRIMHGPHSRGRRTPVRAREMSRKLAIFQSMVDIVNELDIAVFSIVVGSKVLRKHYGKDSIIEYAMTLMLERLEIFARSHNVDTIRIVSDDMRSGDKEKISNIVINSSQGNNSISKMQTSHVTGIEYVDSQSSVLIQVADIMAYIINRYYGGDETIKSVLDELAKIMQKNAGAGIREYELV